MKKTRNCKNLKCILSILLAVLMITSVVPMSLFGGSAGIMKAKAEGTTYKYASDYDGTSAITRVQWLTELTSLFEMSVENDSMLPDNYFSDLTEDSKSYKPMLLAAEFGLIDTEAGENVFPENPATREFAAHTLNLCLAFKLESDDYTFSDSASLTYPDDAQVAVNRGWFTLKDGAFCGDMSLTADEVLTMLNDAKALRAKETVDESADNMFSFADGVVVFENGTDVDYDESGNLIIADSKTELKVGDVFVVFFDGFPSILTAKAVEKTDTGYTIDAEAVEDGTPYIKEISAEGSANVPLDDFIPEDDVEIDYIATRRQARASSKASGNKINVKSMDFSKKIKVADGVTVTIKGNLDKMKFDYNIKSSNGAYFVKLNGNFNLNTTIAFNFGKMFGAPSSVVLGHVKIAGIGKVEVVLDVSATGKVVSDLNGKFCVGFSLEDGDFRFIHEFKKTRSTLTLDLDFDVSLSVTVSVSIASVVKGEAFAMIGMNGHYNMTKYSDGKTPAECKTTAGFMYMRIGAYAKLFSKRYENYITVFDERNSPVRIFFHYEDDVNVPKCTRNAQGHSKYYTPAGSVYGLPYSRNGSSKGDDRYGKPFTRYEYSLDDDGNATITKYNGNVSSIIIPEKLDGHTVVKIGNSVFENRTELVSVMLPDTVTEIGYSAFENCKNLKTVILSNNLTTIYDSAFSGCISLNGVVLPSSMLYIYYDAFYNCTSLTKINIPKNMVAKGNGYGGYGVFRNCSALKTVEFEAGITSISMGLFQACTGLESITIPDTVTKIGDSAFEDCKNLKTVILSNNLTTIYSNAFNNCSSLIDIIIPNGVTLIGQGVFNNCSSLKTIDIPDSVGAIDTGWFFGCTSLEKVKLPQKMPYIPGSTFSGCAALKDIVLPETITYIGDYAFKNCASLENINLPDRITQIGNSAFSGCVKLNNVNLPVKLEKIFDYAFNNCDAFTKVEIPDGCKSIGEYAFANCDLLETVTLSDSVTGIYSGAFMNCEKLKTINFGTGATVIASRTFKDCPSIEKVVIPKGIKTIYDEAFMNDINLTDITIPVSVTSISKSAFNYTDRTVIKGVKGSYAETFAKEMGFKFEDIAKPIEGICLKNNDTDTIYILNGKTIRPEFEIEPVDNTDVLVFTSNNSCVRVNGNGTLYGNYNGSSVITVKAFGSDDELYSFTVNVRSVSSVTVNTVPIKTDYKFGEPLDTTGLTVSVKYSDGVIEQVTGFTVSGYDPEVYGEQTVRVSYEGRSATFKVNVIDDRVKLTGIEITALPAKTEYLKGEDFDPTGLKIVASYTDGTSKEINGYTLSKFNKLKLGTQTITVTYEGFTTTFNVSVAKSECEHVYTEQVTTPATCSAPGVKTFTCSLCGHFYSESISKTAHTEVIDAAVAPTCSAVGKTEGKHCSVCGEVIIAQNDIPKTAHTEVIDAAVPATCTSTGKTEGKHCSVCGEVIIAQNDIPKTAHTEVIDAAVPATCTSTGKTEGKHCSVCGEVIIAQNDIPKTAHTEVIDAAVPATCTSTGKTEGEHCSVCGEVLIAQKVTDRVAHSFGEWQTKTAPTPSSEGTDVRKCAVCGFEETRTVAKLAPTEIKVDDQNSNIKNKDGFVTVVTSVTVTQIITSTGGNTQIHDKDGNEVKSGAKIATGMTVAIVSGGTIITQQTIVVMGDVDCDGDVQVGDARLALRAAVGLDTISGAVQAAASITHGLNEAVAVSDARYILRAAVALDKPEDWLKN